MAFALLDSCWRALLPTVLAVGVALSPAWLRSATARGAAVPSPVQVVVDLGDRADLTRLVAADGDLYVIDAASNHVRRYLLHGLPYAELFTQVMRWKESADGVIMGRPLDLAIQGGQLSLLDDLGDLWHYDGLTYARAIVPLRLLTSQGDLRAITPAGAQLVALDPTRRALWRYRRDTRGGFDTAPQALVGPGDATLARAVRLAVSPTAVLILTGGQVVAIPLSGGGERTVTRWPEPITGLWAAPSERRYLVALAHAVALVDGHGRAVWWRAIATGADEALRDLAFVPPHTLYVLTAHRILSLSLPGGV